MTLLAYIGAKTIRYGSFQKSSIEEAAELPPFSPPLSISVRAMKRQQVRVFFLRVNAVEIGFFLFSMFRSSVLLGESLYGLWFALGLKNIEYLGSFKQMM